MNQASRDAAFSRAQSAYDRAEPPEPEYVEDLYVCIGCGDEFDNTEGYRSETLDGPLCVGCQQDGDNP